MPTEYFDILPKTLHTELVAIQDAAVARIKEFAPRLNSIDGDINAARMRRQFLKLHMLKQEKDALIEMFRDICDECEVDMEKAVKAFRR